MRRRHVCYYPFPRRNVRRYPVIAPPPLCHVFGCTKESLCESCQRRVTIDALDDVLLEIFVHYLLQGFDRVNAWLTLAHVSRKWRSVVFGSQHRLNLRLRCSSRTPTREMLTIWPPLPIIIQDWGYSAYNKDNIIAALEPHDRVCKIELAHIPSSFMAKLVAGMQEPFPALTYLDLRAKEDTWAPVISDTFLGGFAPNLEKFSLRRIPIPFTGLRESLLSATNLVTLYLHEIPHSAYFSPEAIVTCLSVMTRLETLYIEFESPQSRPHREHRRPPPPTRNLLPALRTLRFNGVSEFLEDLVARIDAPQIRELGMSFFHQPIFDTPRLAQFISRGCRKQKDGARNEAHVIFSDQNVTVLLPQQFAERLELAVLCKHSDWQLSALAQVCNSSFPQASILAVQSLYIRDQESSHSQLHWQYGIENNQWLELLHPFTGVNQLFLSREFAPRIAPALQELVGGRTNEVLPTLQSISWEGLQPSGVVPGIIQKFVTARHLSDHPVAVIPWENQLRRMWW